MDHKIINLISLAAFVYYPSIPIVLVLIHGAVKWWLKIGTKSYWLFLLFFGILDLMALLLVLKFRAEILSWRLYNNHRALLGLTLLTASAISGIASLKALSFKTLMALPEINPDKTPSRLVSRGIYKYVRHPRYLEFILEILGLAILSGLAINFLLLLYFVPMIYWAARLEEKELIGRFGEEYLEYKQKTRMFL